MKLPSIEMDQDGYPTDDSLLELEAWEGDSEDLPALLDVVAQYFENCGFGSAWVQGNCWHFVTGGWSGCEAVIAHLPILARYAWESSHRGGLHVYSLGEEGE